MKKFINNLKTVMAILAMTAVAVACNKLDRPALGDYPKDANPPGGPLKFYAAFDAPNNPVDSIRANYGLSDKATLVPNGASGNAVEFTNNGFVSFPSANDFGASTSFTISFFINIPLAKKDNNHAVGVLSFANTGNFWSNIVFYADNNTKSASDSMDLKVHFSDGGGDNWNFAGYNYGNAWPKMYDGQWHQIGFTYDAVAKVGTMYRDGVQFDRKTNQSIQFKNAGPVIVGGFQQAANLQGTYAGNTWMAGFAGKIDQLRLYNTALTAAEMQTLFANKQ